jgi:hydroxymethylbilane synthase
VGTCSLRRLAQLKEQRPDLDIHPLRGNVNTRLKKLHDQEFSAILLAAAGLSRLQMNHEISEEFSPSKFTPAGGQGIIGVQISEKNRDSHLHQLLQQVSCELATAAAFAERHFLRKLGGSCRSPIGIHAVPNSTGWRIDAFLAGGPNGPYLREGRNCSKDNLMETADQLADLILAQGGAAMIKEQWQLTQNQEVSQSAEKSKNV